MEVSVQWRFSASCLVFSLDSEPNVGRCSRVLLYAHKNVRKMSLWDARPIVGQGVVRLLHRVFHGPHLVVRANYPDFVSQGFKA